MQDSARKFIKQAQGAKAVGGGTDAAVAIEKEQQNQKQAEVVAQANAAFEDRKENIDASYRADLARVNQNIQQTKRAQAEATAQAAGAASSALMQGALAAYDSGKGTSWFGNANNTPAGGSPGAGGTGVAIKHSTLSGYNYNYRTMIPSLGGQSPLYNSKAFWGA